MAKTCWLSWRQVSPFKKTECAGVLTCIALWISHMSVDVVIERVAPNR